MQDLVFIGDEVTAAAFRLAGVATRVPDTNGAARALSAEMPNRRVILTTTQVGESLPRAMVERLLCSRVPVVVFLPDLPGVEGAMDLAARVRRELGIEGER